MSNILNDLDDFFETQDIRIENLALQKILIEYTIILTNKDKSHYITSSNQYLLDKIDDDEYYDKILKWSTALKVLIDRNKH